MRIRGRKWEIAFFPFYDHTGIEKHLEKMAEKGWLIEEIKKSGWFYRKIEPQKLKFEISYFYKSSQFDPEPSEEEASFLDFCAHTGWKLACSAAQMKIFYHEGEDPTPIQTDPILEVESIHKSAKKILGINNVFIPILLILEFLFFRSAINDPIYMLTDPFALLMGISILCLLILSVKSFLEYNLWYHRAREAAEDGEFLDTKSHVWIDKMISFLLLMDLGYWVINTLWSEDSIKKMTLLLIPIYLFGIFVLADGVRNWLRRKNMSKGKNIVISIILVFLFLFLSQSFITYYLVEKIKTPTYQEKIERKRYVPIALTDMGLGDKESYIQEVEEASSIFYQQIKVYDHKAPWLEKDKEDTPGLIYTITLVKMPSLYDMTKKSLLRKKDERKEARVPEEFKDFYKKEEDKDWGAKEVYRLVNQNSGPYDEYLLCYSDRIIEVSMLKWKPTVQEKKMMGEQFQVFTR